MAFLIIKKAQFVSESRES